MAMELAEILTRHVARNRMSVNHVMDAVAGREASPVVQRLVKQGRLKAIKGAIPGGLSYYQVSEAEARRLGLPEPASPNPATTRKNWAVLWSVCMTGRERLRLIPSEMKEMSQDDGLVSPHIADRDGEKSCVYRVFVPDPAAKNEPFLESIRENAFRAIEHQHLSEWIKRGTYRFLVLVTHDDRKERLHRLFSRRDFPNLTVELEVVPAFEAIHLAARLPLTEV